MPDAPVATAGCREPSGQVAPFVDRNRCEGKADCVRVCPYGVFQIRKLTPEDRSSLSTIASTRVLKTRLNSGSPMSVGQQTSA